MTDRPLPGEGVEESLLNRINELRTENERLRANNERLLKAAYGLQDDVEALQQQRAELILKNERLRAALQGIADNPDPLDGKCYCRWSKGVARQAIGLSAEAPPQQPA